MKTIGDALCVVMVSVAVSETGLVECCIADNNTVRYRDAHKEWMDGIRKSDKLWSVKHVRIAVPVPVSFEDMVDREDEA